MTAMRILLVAVMVALVAVGVAAASAPMTRASVVTALEAKLKAAEVVRATRLPGSPSVSCAAVAPSARAPIGVQCFAKSSVGRIMEAVSATVGCGARGESPCVRLAACVYSVSVLAPPPKVVSTFSVSVCSSKT